MNESPVQDGSADILIYTCWCTSFLNAYKQTDHTYRYKASFQLHSSGAQGEVVFRYPSRRQIVLPIDGRLLGSLWPRDANGIF